MCAYHGIKNVSLDNPKTFRETPVQKQTDTFPELKNDG